MLGYAINIRLFYRLYLSLKGSCCKHWSKISASYIICMARFCISDLMLIVKLSLEQVTKILWGWCSYLTGYGLLDPVYKDGLPRYGDFHHKNMTAMGPSYLYNGNSYTDKTTSYIETTPESHTEANRDISSKKMILINYEVHANVPIWKSHLQNGDHFIAL